jgi:hypothetical protein
MTEDAIEEGIHGGGEEAGGPREANEVRDRDYEYGRTPRHRPFSTRAPGHEDEDEEREEEEAGAKRGRAGRIVLLGLSAVVLLAVLFVALYLLAGGRRPTTEVQVGSTAPAVGEERKQEEARRDAQAALKAVTESAAAPAPTPASPHAGDLSAPVAPDPLSSAGFDPRSVSPYAQQPVKPPVGDATTATAAGESPQQAPPTPTPQVESAPRPSSGVPPSASYYFFPKEDAQPRASGGAFSADASQPSPVKPPYGTIIPVRLLDSVATLRDGGGVRLETTRTVYGPGGWRIQRGTTLVAKLSGGQNDRAYLSVEGYIDPATNRRVQVGGDVKGQDGAQGLRGERRRANSRWSSALKSLGNAGVTLGSSYLLGRGGGYFPAPAQAGLSEAMPRQDRSNDNLDFIFVRAGAPGFVMITDLPHAIEGRDAPTLDAQGGQITDEELSRLLTDARPEEIRAALPRMSPELRRVAEALLAQEARGGGRN